jgi:hypothetical protein
MAGSRPLVGPICQDDINLIAGCWSWMENDTLFPTTIWPDFYNARIWTVMARSICDLGYSRLWQDEDA